MKKKPINNLADLQVEKQRILLLCKERELELNGKLKYMQENIGSIMIQSLLPKKENFFGLESSGTDEKSNNFLSGIIEGLTGIKMNGVNTKVLLNMAYTVLPPLVLAFIKGYLKKKFFK